MPDPFWWAPKRGPTPAALTPIDLVECLCGRHVWISADGLKREYGEGEPHACPLDLDPADFYEHNPGGPVYRRTRTSLVEVESTSIPDHTPSTNGVASDEDDALRGL